MNKLNLHPYQPAELSARIAAHNVAVIGHNARRTVHDAFKALPSDRHGEITHGIRTAGGPPSTVTATTFATAEQALAFSDARKRESFALPLDGLAIIAETEAIRRECMAAWAAHAEALKATHAKAVEGAQKDAAKFKGLSAAALAQHVIDATAESKAAMTASIPEGETWHSWATETLTTERAELLKELQTAFHRYA